MNHKLLLFSALFMTTTFLHAAEVPVALEPPTASQLRMEQKELSDSVFLKLKNLPADATDSQKFLLSSIQSQLFTIYSQITLRHDQHLSLEEENRLMGILADIREELEQEL